MLNRTPFVLSLLLPALVAADAIDRKVEDFVRLTMVPGVAVAVVRDGEVVKAKGYGFANVEWKARTTAETVFRLASVSKQFVTTAVMLLQQDGKLRASDPLRQHLPEAPDAWANVTIAQLMSHTSGLPTESPGFRWYEDRPINEVIKAASMLPLRFEPGSKYEYCNFGYFVLAEIVNRVAGEPWDALLERRVFDPLGMNATRATTATALVEQRAMGYEWKNGELRNLPMHVALRPSGGTLSNVLDLAKWDRALKGAEILSEATKAAMWTPITLNDGKTHPYGFGWELATKNGHRIVAHGGAANGFRTHFARYPDHGVAVVVLTNEASTPAEQLSAQVAAIALPALKSSSPAEVSGAPSPKVRKVAALLDALEAGKAEGSPLMDSLARTTDWATHQERFAGFGKRRALVGLVNGTNAGKTEQFRAAYEKLRFRIYAEFQEDRISQFRFELED